MTNQHQYQVKVSEMYSNLSTMLLDVPDHFDVCIPILRSLLNQNMNGIRQSFKDGFTPFIVPNLMESFDNLDHHAEIEIRVLDENGKTLGILVNSEIIY